MHGLICRASTYAAQWCEVDSDNKPVVETVPIMNVGVHKGNRGGVYTQGIACKTLLKTIIMDGFDKTQANSQGLAVRERPEKCRSDAETILQYNINEALSLIHI